MPTPFFLLLEAGLGCALYFSFGEKPAPEERAAVAAVWLLRAVLLAAMALTLVDWARRPGAGGA